MKPQTENQPLTPDDILDRLEAAIARKSDAEQEIEECKTCLALMRKEGLIGNTVQTDSLKLSWQTRSSWTYSAAIKTAQQMEQVEGLATKKESASWTVRRTTPTF